MASLDDYLVFSQGDTSGEFSPAPAAPAERMRAGAAAAASTARAVAAAEGDSSLADRVALMNRLLEQFSLTTAPLRPASKNDADASAVVDCVLNLIRLHSESYDRHEQSAADVRRLQSDLARATSRIAELQTTCDVQARDCAQLQQDLKSAQAAHAKEVRRLSAVVDELRRKVSDLTMHQKRLLADSRKKETEAERVRDELRKSHARDSRMSAHKDNLATISLSSYLIRETSRGTWDNRDKTAADALWEPLRRRQQDLVSEVERLRDVVLSFARRAGHVDERADAADALAALEQQLAAGGDGVATSSDLYRSDALTEKVTELQRRLADQEQLLHSRLLAPLSPLQGSQAQGSGPSLDELQQRERALAERERFVNERSVQLADERIRLLDLWTKLSERPDAVVFSPAGAVDAPAHAGFSTPDGAHYRT